MPWLTFFFLFFPWFLQRRRWSAPTRAVLRGCSDRTSGSSWRYHMQFWCYECYELKGVLWAHPTPQVWLGVHRKQRLTSVSTAPRKRSSLKIQCLLPNSVTCTGVGGCFCDCQTRLGSCCGRAPWSLCKRAPEGQGTEEVPQALWLLRGRAPAGGAAF